MRTFQAALFHKSIRWGLALGIVHLGLWWGYRLIAGELPGDVPVSFQTGMFNLIASVIGLTYLGEHDLLGSTWRWFLGLTAAGTFPVFLAYLAGC